MRDMKSEIDFATSIAPAAITATATGTGINCAGYNAVTVLLNVGTVTDGTHTPKLQEADADTGYTDVAAADLIGAFVAIVTVTNQRVGYKGTKKWLRVVSTVASATTGGVYGAMLLRGHALKQPLA